REFWQRVEDRNKTTATLVDRLGLPEYFAMESYVVRRNGKPLVQETVSTAAQLSAVSPVRPRTAGIR
ncbi:MAG TPA: hypothetical protein VFZ04_16365, partial [Longimicrobiales bacterium]